MREGSGVGAGLGTKMGARTGVPLLLMLALLLNVAGCAAKGTSDDAKAKVFPWKTGDVIKAEYVDSGYGQGYIESFLMTPEREWILISQDPENNCIAFVEHPAGPKERKEQQEWCDQHFTQLSAIESTSNPRFPDEDVVNDANFGRQMLITVRYITDKEIDEDGTVRYDITASKVQLDTDPNAPRNTYVLPSQEITGTIDCPNSNDVYLITAQGTRHELVAGNMRNGFFEWCDVEGTVTLRGEILLWTEQRYFRTWDAPPSPEDTSD